MVARVVVAGAGGQVGRLLVAEAARRGFEVSANTRSQWDISDAAAAERFIAAGDLVINCAAYTDVDGAESDPDAAYAINARGPENLARACLRVGAKLVHVSTDYVYRGEEPGRAYEIDDATGPVSVYGKSKLAGDLAVLDVLGSTTTNSVGASAPTTNSVGASAPSVNVVRTSWVYTGGSGSDFVAVMRRLAATDRVIDVVADQTGSPTYARDLVGALLEVGQSQIPQPILHASNSGAASRFEQAQAVFEEVGADPERVRPVTTAQMPRPAPRPVCSALSGDKSVQAGLSRLRPWRDALAEALRERD